MSPSFLFPCYMTNRTSLSLQVVRLSLPPFLIFFTFKETNISPPSFPALKNVPCNLFPFFQRNHYFSPKLFSIKAFNSPLIVFSSSRSTHGPYPLVSDLTPSELEYLTRWLDFYQCLKSRDGVSDLGEIVAHHKEFREQQLSGQTKFVLPPKPEL